MRCRWKKSGLESHLFVRTAQAGLIGYHKALDYVYFCRVIKLFSSRGAVWFGLGWLLGWANMLPAQAQAPFPFFDGFESGSLSSYWSATNTPNGRIRVTTLYGAYEGQRVLAMDATNYVYALNEVVLTADLSGQTNVFFSCQIKDFYNDSEIMPSQFVGSVNAEGIAVSDDGVTWHRVTQFKPSNPFAYTNITADLIELATSRGLTLHGQFKIKFQQYDYYPLETEFGGYILDNVRLFDGSQAADISVSVKDSIDPVVVSSNLTYTLSISNAGLAVAENVILSNRWPAAASFVSADISQGTWITNGNLFVADIGTLSPGSSVLLTLVVQPQSQGWMTNIATISSSQEDILPDNNHHTEKTYADFIGGDVLFSPATYFVDESVDFIQVRVIRTNRIAGAVSLDYETVNGSALAGSDFIHSSGTLTLTNGMTNFTWSIPVVNDNSAEAIESFTVRLFNPTGDAVLVSPSNATITIRDNDGIASVPFDDDFESASFSNVWETYTTGVLGPIITISNQPHAGTRHVTMNGDYISYSLNELVLSADLENREGVYLSFWHKRFPYESDNLMPVTFTGHQSYDGVAISVNGTNWYRAHALALADTGTNEYRKFEIALDPIFAANGLTPNGQVRIKFQMVGYYYPPYYGRFFDDISLYTRSGSLRFGQSSWEAGEGTGSLTVTVERVSGDSGEVSVDYTTSDGTASSGSDFSSATGTLVFANGERGKTFSVPILEDGDDEPLENFIVQLFNPTGGADFVAPTQAVVVIIDNDGPGEFVFGSASYVESEASGLASIEVLRRYGTNGAVSVQYFTAAGTATPGVDYVESADTLFFADGVIQQFIELPILDDNMIEGPETVKVTLQNPAGGATLGALTTTTLTLLDDEAPRASFPYYDGFESGVLSNYWTSLTNATGRIQLVSTTNSFEVNRCLVMDSQSGFSLKEAVLTIDLSDQTNVLLRCWSRNVGDVLNAMPPQFTGSTNADGVAVSIDGITWYRAISPAAGTSSGFTNHVVDLYALASQYGLTLTETFQIKFQHYGNATWPSGGRAFDHISVVPEPSSLTGTICFQGFEGEANDNWSFNVVPLTSFVNVQTNRSHSGKKSAQMITSQVLNSDPIIEFQNINIANYNHVFLTIGYSANGPDSGDDLYLDISYDNGQTWNGSGSVKLVDGFSNASVPFGGTSPSNPTTVPTNPYTIDIPDDRSQIKIRIRYDQATGTSGALDTYFVDHILLGYSLTNQPPVIIPIADQTAYVSNTMSFNVTANDIDQGDIALTASNLPPGATFNAIIGQGTASQVFQFTPDVTQAGSIYPVTFNATDIDGQHSITVAVVVLDQVLTFEPHRLVTSEGSGAETVTVRMSRSTDAEIFFSISGFALHAPQGDYTLSATSLLFSIDGPSEHSLVIQPVDDTAPEGLESAVINTISSPGVVLGSPPLELVIRDNDSITIASANLTSGGTFTYQAPGWRILETLQADIVAIQEFKVTNAAGYRAFVDQHFGTEYDYYVEPSSLPNGVISRWPILAAGRWNDVLLSDREFVWATIDIPGGRPLHVISVHLFYSGGASARESEARALTNFIAQAGYHPSDYVVLCGDMNTQNRNEPALQVLTMAVSDSRKPADQYGDTDTNQNRDKPYDFVLPNSFLNSRHLSLNFNGLLFPEGLVFDTRLWNNPSPPAPALMGDSGMPQMQHMAVMKLFALDNFVTILTEANAGGSIFPPNPEVGLGSNQTFIITADPYHYIVQIATNGSSWMPAGDPVEQVLVWSNVVANGWLNVMFAEDLTEREVPHYWLAAYGLTNQEWEVEEELDQDQDGFFTWEEYLTDTDPSDPESQFEVYELKGSALRQITFQSSTARVYAVQYATNGPWTGSWPSLHTGLTGSNMVTTVTDTNSGPFRIYRIQVSKP